MLPLAAETIGGANGVRPRFPQFALARDMRRADDFVVGNEVERGINVLRRNSLPLCLGKTIQREL